MTKKAPIVITSIFPPNNVIEGYAKLGHEMIIVADKKTPTPWEHELCHFVSVEDQQGIFPNFTKLQPFNHYTRKNIGYLLAIEKVFHSGYNAAAGIIETDDDNFPYDFYPNFVTKKTKSLELTSSHKFVNVYQQFLSGKQKIWRRGYPLSLLLTEPALTSQPRSGKYLLQQSLINQDTDVDAIYRLTVNQLVKFKAGKKLSLAPHTYAPINTQNTFWLPEAFLLMYLPSTVSSRVCDIYKGWIAQRLIWELNSTVLFTSPSVYQDRNPHNYLKDFEQELELYLNTEKYIQVLEQLELSGSIENKLVQTYQALISAQLLKPEELDRVKEWIVAVQKITG